MHFTKLCVLFLFSCVLAVSTHRRESFEEDDIRQDSLTSSTTCGGQSFNLRQLEREWASEIEECLDIKFIDVVEELSNSRRKSDRRQVRNERRIRRILRRECSDECTWDAFGLIPAENTELSSISSNEAKEFSELFPEKARKAVRTGVESCLNSTSYRHTTIDHSFRLRRACEENSRLVECLQRAVMLACRGRGRKSKPKSTTASSTSTTSKQSDETTSAAPETKTTSEGSNKFSEAHIRNAGENARHEGEDVDNVYGYSTTKPLTTTTL